MTDETRSPEQLRREFIEEALESQARVLAGEPVYKADEVLAYLREGRRPDGQQAAPCKALSLTLTPTLSRRERETIPSPSHREKWFTGPIP